MIFLARNWYEKLAAISSPGPAYQTGLTCTRTQKSLRRPSYVPADRSISSRNFSQVLINLILFITVTDNLCWQGQCPVDPIIGKQNLLSIKKGSLTTALKKKISHIAPTCKKWHVPWHKRLLGRMMYTAKWRTKIPHMSYTGNSRNCRPELQPRAHFSFY
jgi:hypothetical protein